MGFSTVFSRILSVVSEAVRPLKYEGTLINLPQYVLFFFLFFLAFLCLRRAFSAARAFAETHEAHGQVQQAQAEFDRPSFPIW